MTTSTMTTKLRGLVLGVVAAMTLSGSVFDARASAAGVAPVAEAPGVGTSHVTAQDVTASATITRDEVLTRAWSWVAENVKYSQKKTHTNQYGTYRTDCSGFVSMAWGLVPDGIDAPNTKSLPDYGTWLSSLDELRPGDAIDKPGTHVVLFLSWADDMHTVANVYEQTSNAGIEGPDPGAIESQWRRSTLIDQGYQPLRYQRITDDE